MEGTHDIASMVVATSSAAHVLQAVAQLSYEVRTNRWMAELGPPAVFITGDGGARQKNNEAQ